MLNFDPAPTLCRPWRWPRRPSSGRGKGCKAGGGSSRRCCRLARAAPHGRCDLGSAPRPQHMQRIDSHGPAPHVHAWTSRPGHALVVSYRPSPAASATCGCRPSGACYPTFEGSWSGEENSLLAQTRVATAKKPSDRIGMVAGVNLGVPYQVHHQPESEG